MRFQHSKNIIYITFYHYCLFIIVIVIVYFYFQTDFSFSSIDLQQLDSGFLLFV